MSDFYAGLISGLVSTFVCNPFDVIRTNVQLNNKVNYSISFLYRGIYSGLVTIPSYWSIYFYSYQKLKERNMLIDLSSEYLSELKLLVIELIKKSLQE